MKTTAVALLACTGALAAPAGASAMLTEIGRSPAAVVPSCPASPCRVVSRTTGFQAKEGSVRGVDVIPADGRIVAWTITLSTPTPKQIRYFHKYFGTSRAQLTIVRPGKHLYYRVIAQGEPQDLEPYFGQTVQFALAKSIPVEKGMVVALTVPDWAPVLATGLPETTSWRASRSQGTCDDFTTPTSQRLTNNVTRFFCLYSTARLAYSATFVPDPKPNPGSTTTKVKAPSTSATTTKPGGTSKAR